MPTPWVPRPQRLVLALLATIIAWLCASIVFISLSPRGIVAEIFLYGTFIAFDYFLLLACPLVLLWPVQSQIKHWYAFLGVAALPCLLVVFLRHPWLVVREIYRNPASIKGLLEIAWPGIPFLFGAACYLLLLRRRQAQVLREAQNAELTTENRELRTEN